MIKTKFSSPQSTITVAGLHNCGRFDCYRDVLNQIKSKFPRLQLEIYAMHETDFFIYVKDMKRSFPDSNIYSHKRKDPLMFLNHRRYVPSLNRMIEVLENLLGFDINFPGEETFIPTYRSRAEKNYSSLLQPSLSLRYSFIALESNASPSNRIIIELFFSQLPKSCENFFKLCEGFNKRGKNLCYKNTKIYKNAGNGYIICGDTTGEGGEGIYEGDLEDENYLIKHDKPGIVGWINKGFRHSNGSMFYITTDVMESFDKRMVAFGRVLQGMKIVNKLAKMKREDLGLMNYKINDCGVYK